MYRLADDMDGLAIVDALLKLEKYASTYEWAAGVDFIKAVDVVMGVVKEGDAYVVDGYLVLVSELMPWYSKKSVLQEWLVLKIHASEHGVSQVPEALLAIAKERGCSMLITADSSPISIVADAYKAAGFQPLTRSFFKKV